MKMCQWFREGKCACEGVLGSRKEAGRQSLRVYPDVMATLEDMRSKSGVSMSTLVSDAISRWPEDGELTMIGNVKSGITICVYLTAEAQAKLVTLCDKAGLQKATVAKAIVNEAFQF